MRKIIVFILSFIFIQSNLLFNDVVNSIVGIVGSMPITYEDFLSRKTFLTLQARSIGQKVTDDMVYKDLVEERVMYLKLKENNFVIEENDVKRRLESIAKQYNMNADQFAKQLMAEAGYTNGEGFPVLEYKTTSDLIYIQAKRWGEDHTVGRPEVQAFVGAIAGKGGKGLFVTTSKFSKQAVEYAKNQHIILLDGEKLTSFMIEHNFGVSTKKVFEIKVIDSDVFNDYKDE